MPKKLAKDTTAEETSDIDSEEENIADSADADASKTAWNFSEEIWPQNETSEALYR